MFPHKASPTENLVNREIERAIGPLIKSLAAQSITAIESHVSESFGNFVVHFRGAGRDFQIIRDRGQLIVDGIEQQELEQAGLFRTFPGFRELETPLMQWLKRSEA